MANSPDLLIHRLRAMLDPSRHETAPDGDLLARWAAEQDARAFAALVWRHGALVWRVSRGVLKHHEDAQDVFQATYFVLAKKAAKLQHRPCIAGWLHETAHRLALKARTASTRRLRRESQAEQKPAVDPLEDLSVCEARAILDEELQRLPAADRDALLLCLYEGATQEAAARQLRCSLSTLKRRLDRGRTLMADQLTRRGLAPSSALAVTLWSTSRAPAELAQQTVMAIERLAAGHAVTGAAVGMADALLRTMLVKKAIIGIALFFAFGSLTVAGGLAFAPAGRGTAAKDHGAKHVALEIAQPQPAPPKDLPPRLDRFGDALPPGAINRLGSIRLRHGSGVGEVLYTPDGKSLASIASDGLVRLWDVATGKLHWRFTIDKAGSYQSALVVSADGKRLAVLGNSDYDQLATDTGKGLTRHELPKAAGDVRCLAIAPDLTTIARGFMDGTVRLYDVATGEEKFRIAVGDKAQNDFPMALAFSADAKMIYVAVYKKVDVMAFDTATGKSLRSLKGEQLAADRLVVSSDRQMLVAITPGDLITPKDDGLVLLWDLTSGKLRHSLKAPGASCGVFSPDGSLFAVGSRSLGSPEVVLFDTASGKKGRLQALRGVLSLAFAPDGKTIAAGDNTGCITMWDLATGKLLPPSPEPGSGFNYGLHFLDGGKQLRSFDDGVSWWDVATGQSIKHWRAAPTRFVRYVAHSISPDETLLVGSLVEQLPDGSFKGDILLIDAATEKTVRTLSGHTWPICSTAFSPDGTKLFSAAGYDPRVIVWDVATGKAVHVLESHAYFVDRLAVSPDGRWLASASPQPRPGEDSDIRLWDVATGKLMRRLTPRLSNPRASVFAMVFSADSSLLASAGFETQLWDVATGKEMRVIPGQKDANVWCVAMTPDGRMLATGTTNTIQLWEIASGAERRRIEGHEDSVYALAFSPESTVLAASSFDAPIYLWDVYGRKINQSATGKLKKEGQERLWQRLADTDAKLAFEAVCELIGRPVEAVALLEEGWKRSPRATSKQMEKWMDDLDSNQFAVRKNATAELERFVTGHEGLLRKALDQATTLEVRQRLENILNRPNPERLRRGRMLEVLEQVATGPARQVLQTFGDQMEDAQLAAEAKACMQRLR